MTKLLIILFCSALVIAGLAMFTNPGAVNRILIDDDNKPIPSTAGNTRSIRVVGALVLAFAAYLAHVLLGIPPR